MNLPADIANQALDAIGRPDMALGDLQGGTEAGKVLLRAYGQCMRQLIRAAHWNWARKQASLVLLADATGNTPLVGTVVPQGWVYEYETPTDLEKPRCVPANWNNPANDAPQSKIQIAATPLGTGVGVPSPVPFRVQPTRFLEAFDPNYPDASAGIDTPGVSPVGRKVILSNVKNATLIYTAFLPYPNLWDSLFRSAFVAYLASEVALPLWAKEDRAFGLRVRDSQEAIVKEKVIQARLTDGNSDGPPTSDIRVDWMDTRYSAGPGMRSGWGLGGPGWGGDGPGMLWGGWDGLAVASGAVF